MVFVLDNYDSFTYNLVQYIGELGVEVTVRRNDQITVDEIDQLHPDRIVISPGPCTPQDAGISIELIRHFAGRVPLLGVCLGHQAIGAAFGGKVVRAANLMHGKTSSIEHDGKSIFRGIPSPMTATRYHSLIVQEKDLPDELEISATCVDRDGQRVIMGLRHRKFPVEGVQFHPESVLTDHGRQRFAGRFDVDLSDAVLQDEVQLRFGLPWTGENDLPGVATGVQGLPEFSRGSDFETRALGEEESQNRLAGISLDRVADGKLRRQGAAQEMPLFRQDSRVIDEERRSIAIGQTRSRHAAYPEFARWGREIALDQG